MLLLLFRPHGALQKTLFFSRGQPIFHFSSQSAIAVYSALASYKTSNTARHMNWRGAKWETVRDCKNTNILRATRRFGAFVFLLPKNVCQTPLPVQSVFDQWLTANSLSGGGDNRGNKIKLVGRIECVTPMESTLAPKHVNTAQSCDCYCCGAKR